MLRRETHLRRRMVAPKRKSPIAIRDGDIMEFVGGTYWRFIWNLLDERLTRVGGEGERPKRRRVAGGRSTNGRGGAADEEMAVVIERAKECGSS